MLKAHEMESSHSKERGKLDKEQLQINKTKQAGFQTNLKLAGIT